MIRVLENIKIPIMEEKLISFINSDNRLKELVESIQYNIELYTIENKKYFEDFYFSVYDKTLLTADNMVIFESKSIRIYCIAQLSSYTLNLYLLSVDYKTDIKRELYEYFHIIQILEYLDNIKFPIFLSHRTDKNYYNIVITNFDVFKFSSEQILEFY